MTEYPIDVPWNLTREQCAELIQYISYPTKSCIVTGGEREKIITLGRELRPDYIQLHYKETLEDVKEVIKALEPLEIKVIKTIPLSEEERLEQFGNEDVTYCAQCLSDIGTAIILVDSRSSSNAAAESSVVDMSFFRQVKAVTSATVMLGGGITPENCGDIIKNFHPEIIDIMTGVEIAQGVKSEEKVAAVMRQIVACRAK